MGIKIPDIFISKLLKDEKNKITSIKDEQGSESFDSDKITEVFINHFNTIFETCNPVLNRDVLNVVQRRIDMNSYNHLQQDFTSLEVYTAMSQLEQCCSRS